MGFNCGIVGLPNVGKSTLFNALTATQAAQAANYPFCTIEPNVGVVFVPDPRLQALDSVVKAERILPTTIDFVDIAGLVRGASKGEGLGNQFLANIRETDAIAHVVRCFEDPDVIHVAGKVDPVSDMETIEIELMLADIQHLENLLPKAERAAKSTDKEAKLKVEVMKKCLAHLGDQKPLRTLALDEPRERVEDDDADRDEGKRTRRDDVAKRNHLDAVAVADVLFRRMRGIKARLPLAILATFDNFINDRADNCDRYNQNSQSTDCGRCSLSDTSGQNCGQSLIGENGESRCVVVFKR